VSDTTRSLSQYLAFDQGSAWILWTETSLVLSVGVVLGVEAISTLGHIHISF